MPAHKRIACPHCHKTFILPAAEAWRDQLPRLFQPFTETASPIATRTLISQGSALGMWSSYPGGARRLGQLEEEGLLIKADTGWWVLSEVGKHLGRTAREPTPLLAGLSEPPAINDQSEMVPVPTGDLLNVLKEFQDFPQFSSLHRIVRYAVACGFIEPRGARGKIASLIANGYLQWVVGKLVLSPASRRILAGELPAVDWATRMNDQPPPVD